MKSTLVLALLTLFALSVSNAFKYENKLNASGVMFAKISQVEISYEYWTICYFYDLTEYFAQIDLFEQNMKQMSIICKKLQNNTECPKLVIHLENHLEKMSNSRTLIENFNSNNRTKRAINFIGKLYNIFFGLLDSDSAEHYNHEIEQLKQNVLKEKDLIKEQLLTVKSNIQVTNATFSEMKHNMLLLEDKLNRLTPSSYTNFWLKENFNYLFQLVTMILINHVQVTESVTDILMNSMQGKIMSMIPFNIFKQHLNEVQYSLRKDQRLPFDINRDSIYSILKIINVKSALYNKRILMEIKIPILRNPEFILYRGIPIPTLVNNKLVMIELKSSLFLIDPNNAKYIPMNQNDMENCLKNDKKMICSPSSPVYFDRRGNCELSLFLEPHGHMAKMQFNYHTKEELLYSHRRRE